jgi:hypothetical protein
VKEALARSAAARSPRCPPIIVTDNCEPVPPPPSGAASGAGAPVSGQ